MSKNKPYDYYSFITQKAPHQYSSDEAALVTAEIENLGHRIDQGIFKKNPALLAAAAQRILQVAQERMGVTNQPALDGNSSDNQASSDGDAPKKNSLFGD